MKGLRYVVALSFVCAIGAGLMAQAPVDVPAVTKAATEVKAPVLTDVQKLQFMNASKDMQIWQLKAEQAANEFEKARVALQKMIADNTPPGYQINDKLELVKTPEPETKK